MRKFKCPKCKATSGDSWTQCGVDCPMPGSPHFTQACADRFIKKPDFAIKEPVKFPTWDEVMANFPPPKSEYEAKILNSDQSKKMVEEFKAKGINPVEAAIAGTLANLLQRDLFAAAKELADLHPEILNPEQVIRATVIFIQQSVSYGEDQIKPQGKERRRRKNE